MAVFTAAQALDMALQIEKNGEAFYHAAAAKAADPAARDIFGELARQEQRHYVAFQKMAARLGHMHETPARSVADEEYRYYLKATLDGHLFSGPDKALAVAEKAEDATLALQGAIGFEKDTLLFYYDLRDMVDESDREVLRGIILEEKSHVQRLASMLG